MEIGENKYFSALRNYRRDDHFLAEMEMKLGASKTYDNLSDATERFPQPGAPRPRHGLDSAKRKKMGKSRD